VEDYPYLNPVPVGNITQELNSLVTVRLPGIDTTVYYYFSHFAIFYRIYVSDIPESGTLQLDRNVLTRINPSLSSDYFALEPYLSTENKINTSSVGAQFRSRNYYFLEVEGDSLDSILGRPASGNIPAKTLRLDFGAAGSRPSLRLSWGGNEAGYTLYRSNGSSYGTSFIPRPDRYFVNTQELSNPSNIGAGSNLDLAAKSGMSPGPRYTYASFYIAAVGMDPVNYSPIYSIPAFLGILRLPDP
jgi:hypothetical protein